MSDDSTGRKPVLKYLEPNYDRYKRSQKHETRLGKRMGGRRLPRSGGMPWSKWDKTTAGGDVSTPDLHIEHKRTDCDSMSLKKDWLVKVSEGARRVAKDPAVIITFEKKGSKPEDWILVPLEVLERLQKKAGGSNDEG